MVYVGPFPTSVPPVAALYHSIGLAELAESITDAAPQELAAVTVGGAVLLIIAFTPTGALGHTVPATA